MNKKPRLIATIFITIALVMTQAPLAYAYEEPLPEQSEAGETGEPGVSAIEGGDDTALEDGIANVDGVETTNTDADEENEQEEIAEQETLIDDAVTEAVEEASEDAELRLTAMASESITDSITGTWSGTYIGTLDDSAIERKLTLYIDYCSDTGAFEGTAYIDSGSNGKYLMDGNINLETGEATFSGASWIDNPSDFEFATFAGMLDFGQLTITGLVDGEEARTFTLKRTSPSYESSRIDFENLPRDWVGEYDGWSGSVIVRRNYMFTIDAIDDDGNISGVAEISPSDKAASYLGASGSYYFNGHIEKRSGKIYMQGYEWITYPESNDGTDDWSFVQLNGNIEADAIIGKSEEGIWAMSSGSLTSETNDGLVMYDKGNHPTYGTWSDRWFAFGSSGYNHELATTASILASAAYNGSQTKTSKFAISKDYDALGFKNKVYKNYDAEGADSVGVSFAMRDASFGNRKFPVVVAAIRGTSNDDEWISNLNVNNTSKDATDLHEGFNAAADEVVAFLEQYLIRNNIRTTNTRILVTGHSRGAAVANLVGYKLDNGYIDYIRKDNVYAYTFATPNTSTMDDVSDTTYDNIFNIVNPEDIVARVPLVGWGFGKYGKTLYLPSKSNCSDFKSYRAAMQAIYSDYTNGDSYSSYATGTWRSRALAFTVLAASPNVWCYYNLRHVSPYRLIPPFSATLHELAESIWTSGGGAALSKAIGYPAYMSLISTILAEEGIEMLSGATSSPGSMGWIKTEVTDGHRPATYVAWMQSGSSVDLFKDAYYGLSVACPVDVRVYDDSGALVASIVDGQVDESLLEDGLAAYVDGDAKCIDIPKDANYRVEATASDSGTMDIAWKEIDADGGTIAQTCYTDLELTEGQSYDIDLSSNRGSGTSGTIDVTSPDGATEYADYTAGSWDVGSLTVEVTTEGNGDALGVVGATRGDQVTVVATPYEGESFIGWYDGEEKVSSDEEYSFRIEDSRSLTAWFTGGEEPTVPVDSITATASKTTLTVGESATITVKVGPDNATNKDVAFSSSDSSIVAVTSAGKVTGKKAGTAKVTVTSTDNGSATKTIAFKVNAKMINISTAKITGVSAKTYTGKKLTQKPTVKVGDKTLKSGTDYSLSYKNNVKVGTASVTVTGKGSYAGTKTVKFKINKAKQPMTAKAKSKTLTAKNLKNKAIAAKGLIVVKKAKGTIAYKNASTAKAPKKFKVNSKNGTITVPKGTKKGTYKVKVKVTAKGNASYKAGSKTVTVTIKVK